MSQRTALTTGVNADCDTGTCPTDAQSSQAAAAAQAEDPTDWTTFLPPVDASLGHRLGPSVVIEFCNRCRWLHRATWVQTELLLTFEDKPAQAAANGDPQTSSSAGGKYATGAAGLKSIQLIPCNAPETGGRFRVWLYRNTAVAARQEPDGKDENMAHGTFDEGKVVLLWDRKIRGGFPELKELKQIIRDQIAPSHSLGHSDRHTANG